MPIIEPSSFTPPNYLSNGHFQTIYPSYFAPQEDISYTRELFDTPDHDQIALDWSTVGSDCLVIINHGLCGHSHRHYVLSFVKAFNDAGWDCLAWNYRATSEDPFLNHTLTFTTNDSTYEIDWLVHYAIEQKHYRKIAITGFSMGGNLTLLYLGRNPSILPREVVGGAVVCAVTDLFASCDKINQLSNRIYSNHLVGKLKDLIRRKHQQFPDKISLEPLSHIHTFSDFDNVYTAPLNGYKNYQEYWNKASGAKYLRNINRKTLMIAPQNDPFLAGHCYPIQEARDSQFLYLEMPESGGHCGFLSAGHPAYWWPAQRAKDFLKPLMDGNAARTANSPKTA